MGAIKSRTKLAIFVKGLNAVLNSKKSDFNLVLFKEDLGLTEDVKFEITKKDFSEQTRRLKI